MITFTATYSPDDNKLRLSASQRLDAATYARVKAHGFKWAPKQEQFIAPMWTPERAALCEELAGEIGDEDSSLAERAEDRAERFEGYSQNRAEDAERAAAAVKSLADDIPLGQPILVGHHSEKRARKDAERIEAGMRRAVNAWKTSEYWTRRAAAALAHAQYKERPDVRARRIARIEADLRKAEKATKQAEAGALAWVTPWERMKKADGTRPTPREAVVFLANRDQGARYYSNSYARPSGYVGPISLWEAAGGNIDGEDPERRAIATVDEICARAIEGHRATVAHYAPWIEHYNFRLSYERAMLAADGGTVADQTGPEVGGAVRCIWAPRGGWAYIVKVNKVTVGVRHQWNAGGRVFVQNVEKSKLREIMTRAQVEEARAAGRLVESEAGLGFYLAEPKPTEGPQEPSAPAPEPKPAAADFEAMAATLKAGGVQVVAAPQLFPTPRDLAERVAREADIQPGHAVLEPSAGLGALIGAAGAAWHANGGRMVAVEIDARLCEHLRREFPLTTVHCADFLKVSPVSLSNQWEPPALFDRIIMNPPFSGAADVRHILHARQFLKPGGRIVAICANGPRQGDALRELAERSGGYFEPLPAGSFEASGTNVNAALCVIEWEPEPATHAATSNDLFAEG